MKQKIVFEEYLLVGGIGGSSVVLIIGAILHPTTDMGARVAVITGAVLFFLIALGVDLHARAEERKTLKTDEDARNQIKSATQNKVQQ